jgi:WD40 repeat protein
MQTFRLFIILAIGLLLVCAAALSASLGLRQLRRSPVALFLGDDERLTYLDLAHHTSLTTAQSVTLGPQHTMMVSPNGRYVFNQNAPHTLYDTYEGKMTTLSMAATCVKFQLSDQNVGCIDQGAFYVAPLNGDAAGHQFATYPVNDYVWLPDGQGVIFTEWRSPQTFFWFAPTFASKPKKIATAQGLVYLTNASPDGRYVISLAYANDHWSLLLAGVNDGSSRTLDYDPSALNNHINGLAWSPDSQRIVVWASTGEIQKLADPQPSYILNIANDTVTPLSDDTGDVHWSPDGSHLLYLALRRFDVSGLLKDYFVAQADGSHEIRVAHNPTGSYFWSADGTQMDVIRQGKLYELPLTDGVPVAKVSWPISTSAVPTVMFYWR